MTEVQRTLESAAMWISSRRESSACKIFGFSEASVFDLSSMPQHHFTRAGRSVCISLDHDKTIMFSSVGVSSSSSEIVAPW